MSDFPPPSQPSGFSNYPRANYTGNSNSPYQRPPGIYFESIGLAWNLVKANLGLWVGAVLLMGVISYAITAPFTLGGNMVLYGNVLGTQTGFDFTKFLMSMAIGILPGLVQNVLYTGLLYMGVKTARCEPVGIGDLFVGFQKFGSLMMGAMLLDLLYLAGFICFIIPVFYLCGVLAFVQLLILDRKMAPWDAVVASYTALKSDGWMMFLLLLVVGFISGIGVCGCCVGVLFTVPIAIVTIGLTYNNYFPGGFSQMGGAQIGVEPPR